MNGKIIDRITQEPLPYAEILLRQGGTSKKNMFGGITNQQGIYKISKVPYGSYQLVVSFMGYANVEKNIIVNASGVDIETIGLKEKTEGLDEVVVKSSKAAIQYKVDRQVINASGFPSADVAIDLLANVPSLQVDVNDNIKYRGDGVFKVYINGHPAQNGTDKLRQISAAQIDKIEVITNPSTAYSSEGTAGIINVLLKKNRLEGYTVNANARTSTLGAITGYFSVDKKLKKWGWYVNLNGGKSIWSRIDTQREQIVTDDNLQYVTQVDQDEKNGQTRMYMEAGFNYDLTDNDYIDLAFTMNPIETYQFNRHKGNVVTSITNVHTQELQDIETYKLVSNRYTEYHYLGGILNYSHNFNKAKTHKISSYIDISTYISSFEEQKNDEKHFVDNIEKVGYENYEKNELVINAKLEYNVPISKKSSFDTGLELDIDDIPEIGSTSGYFDTNNQLIPFSYQRNNQRIDFAQHIFSGFVNFKSNWEKFEYQLGLRLENTSTKSNYAYTDINGEDIFIPSKNNFSNLFPSIHLMYNLNEQTQWVVNYTRRISRPGYYNLVPLVEYSDIISYYTGNANIRPSYINAYELGYKRDWNQKDFLSIQVFHRKTTGVREQVSYADQEGKLMYKPENVGYSYSTGSEFMGNLKCSDWWETNLSISLFMYRLNVDFLEEEYSENQFNHNFKWNNIFNFPKAYLVKINMDYSGPTVTAQKHIKPIFNASMSIKKSFWDEACTFTLSGNNIFNTNKRRITSQGAYFSAMERYGYKPSVALKMAYKFDNQN
ncbi:MAG: TonB-dependent receptor domain-containing protein [Aestuariibaculum sp.]